MSWQSRFGDRLCASNVLFSFRITKQWLKVIHEQTSTDRSIMVLLRHFVLCTLKYNILFHAKHISGCINRESDALSRLQVEKFRIQAPSADPQPTPVPGGLLPMQLAHHLTELLHSTITKGSRKTYERAWKTYVEFSSEFCDSRCSLLPVSVNNLALFISYLSAKKFASSTI